MMIRSWIEKFRREDTLPSRSGALTSTKQAKEEPAGRPTSPSMDADLRHRQRRV
jgi:hypothetical protein